MTKKETAVAEYDSPWKKALENYFQPFMLFFFPVIHAEIDWSKGWQFLDTQLAKIVRDATMGARHADRLVKVFLLDGAETWILIHIEIQGYYDKTFEKRMFVYILGLHLFRLLFKRGYEKKDILELIRFIDWLLFLPDYLEKEVQQEIRKIEEENKMEYVTSYERFGRQDGMLINAREMLLDAIEARFQVIPEEMATTVKKIEARETLKSLLRETITCQSIDALREAMSAHGN